MNENQLVSLDDAALDQVNGGLSFSVSAGEGASLSFSATFKKGIALTAKLFGETLKASFSFFE